MGADGHWMLLRKEEWNKAWPDVKPEDCGLRETTVLGIDVVTCYWDTSDRDDREYGEQGLYQALDIARSRLNLVLEKGDGEIYVSPLMGFTYRRADLEKKIEAMEANPKLPYSRKCWEAVMWFEARAENHEVWT